MLSQILHEHVCVNVPKSRDTTETHTQPLPKPGPLPDPTHPSRHLWV